LIWFPDFLRARDEESGIIQPEFLDFSAIWAFRAVNS
jgi:hypothetical protein